MPALPNVTVSHAPEVTVLSEPEWRARQAAHEARVRAWTEPHQLRQGRGEKHPVYDFLFTYYAFRPAWLRQWHPGPDVVLTGDGAREFLRWPEYRVWSVDSPRRLEATEPSDCHPERSERSRIPAKSHRELDSSRPHGTTTEATVAVAIDATTLPVHRRDFVAWLRELLTTMQTRPAFFGCYGLHEWAMVYRQRPEDIRHHDWPLRFPPEEIAGIVERSAVCCSHFDAFRFFTALARPLNRLQPTRMDAANLEQRGCLHANMDLYKWAFKLAPFPPAELIADCFELARDIREVDMRASPYDLRSLGFAPIAIETPEGRLEYERQQRAFATRGEPLRAKLIGLCARLLRRA